MPRKSNESFENDLNNLRSRLLTLNKKIKTHAAHKRRAHKPSPLEKKSSPDDVSDEAFSIDDARTKLKTINEYLKKKLSSERQAEERRHSPSPPSSVKENLLEGGEKKSLAKEISHEQEELFSATPEKEKEVSVEKEVPSLSLGLRDEVPAGEERRGVGLDLGTAYIVASREIGGEKVFIKNERNAFLSARKDESTKSLLNELRIKYAIVGDDIYVLGNLALKFANIFNREVQRSMDVGILNPTEAKSIPIIKLIIQNILWPRRGDYEHCCYSIPAKPIDRAQDTIYHKSVFEGILKILGFIPVAIDEGYAVVLSELEYADFTGIGVSCGGGMVNVCAAYKSIPVLSFSVTRGGDWIDRSAAAVLGIPASQVTIIKEEGLHLNQTKSREQEAIVIYYKNYIRYFLEQMAKVFNNSRESMQLKGPIDIVFAGGSSLVGGFLDTVKEELRDIKIDLQLGELRMAIDPFTSVSRGCLFHAINFNAHAS